MKLKINFEVNTIKVRSYILVCIKRGKKDGIIYNSGLLYFSHKEAAELFKGKVEKTNPEIKVLYVDVYKAHKPNTLDGKGYWCPYCQSWEYWKSDSSGNKRCPVCKMSDNDYYVKLYNGLWVREMESMTKKRKSDNLKTKARKSQRKEQEE